MPEYFLNLNRKKEDKRYNNYPLIIILLSYLPLMSLFIPKVFAQDYTRWELPEGAKLRLGKGSVQNLTFSVDGTRLYVDSSIGSAIGTWLYDVHTGNELKLFTDNE